MQHHQSFKLSPGFVSLLIGDENNRIEKIVNELESHVKEISSLLTSYHWNERGMVHGIKIDAASVQINQNGKGSFRVMYGINIHYGCSDMDIELDNKMTIAIDANLETGEALLTGEYIPEREPDF